MIISLLLTNPIMFFAWAVSMIFAITIHEFSHALAGTLLGDPTAKNQGRLTLNPLKHMDIWGTLLMLFVGFGWGKPVPFNPYNLKNQRIGPAIVALAGPFSNLILVVIFVLLLKFVYPLTGLGEGNALFDFLYTFILINALLLSFNVIPVPPLDGSKLLFALLPPSAENVKMFLDKYGFFVLIGLLLIGGSLFSRYFYWVIGIIDKFLA
ncbi:MAG: site-2 protease family protein [Patescibacteria group bacterium]|nr:site-2 protease family protein [Patescibacteria group bacterium]